LFRQKCNIISKHDIVICTHWSQTFIGLLASSQDSKFQVSILLVWFLCIREGTVVSVFQSWHRGLLRSVAGRKPVPSRHAILGEPSSAGACLVRAQVWNSRGSPVAVRVTRLSLGLGLTLGLTCSCVA
jgi:hypothetical protein